MRLSEFKLAVADEFGDTYGRALARELALGDVGGLTADQALAAGRDPRKVWEALCREADVPRDRWHGRGRLPPQ